MKPAPERQWEDWRPIEWYEGIYDINELGQVRSYRKIWNGANCLNDKPLRYILQSWYRSKKDWPQRATLCLYDWMNKRKLRTARVMAKTFLWMSDTDYSDRRVEVIHLDWDMMNCRLDNLKVTNPSERALNYHKHKKEKNF